MSEQNELFQILDEEIKRHDKREAISKFLSVFTKCVFAFLLIAFGFLVGSYSNHCNLTQEKIELEKAMVEFQKLHDEQHK